MKICATAGIGLGILGIAAWLALVTLPDSTNWLLAPLDSTRPHNINATHAWHARLMVLAWGVLAPTGVLIARFMKVTPRQAWPSTLDNQVWWKTHLTLQSIALILTVFGIALVWQTGANDLLARIHRAAAWTTCGLVAFQAMGGMLRGSKGGCNLSGRAFDPADPQMRGDHYDMSPRRLAFEALHKIGGYAALLFAVIAIVVGLLLVNAPRWMAICIGGWWVLWCALFIVLQRRGWCIDTYQAIWGPDPAHPGNQRRPIGPGVRRYGDDQNPLWPGHQRRL